VKALDASRHALRAFLSMRALRGASKAALALRSALEERVSKG